MKVFRHLLAAGLMLAAPAWSVGVTAAPRPAVTGYVAWWLGDAWATTPLEGFERIVFIEQRIDASGRISEPNGWPEDWQGLRDAARQAGVGIDLSLGLVQESDFAALFTSPSARRQLLRESARLLDQPGVAGLHIDIEVYRAASTSPAALDGFRAFVETLAQRARRSKRWELSVFLPIGGEVQLYTPATLAGMSRVVVQGYDAHWPEGPRAGPVAPLRGPDPVTWAKALAEARALGVDDARLRLAFPLYGYEWPVEGEGERRATTGKGRALPFAPLPAAQRSAFPSSVIERVARHGAVFDAESGSGRYTFEEAGTRWEGWFEDSTSLQIRRQWLSCEGLDGLAVFALGYDAGLLVSTLASPIPAVAACTTPPRDGEDGADPLLPTDRVVP